MADAEFVIVGRVRRAHGLRGELLVEPFTDEPDAHYASGRRLFAGDDSGTMGDDPDQVHVVGYRPMGGGPSLLLSLAEVSDRTAAEQWRGRYLFVPANEVTPPREGEVFLHELPGMRVVDADGVDRGEVSEVYELPQGIMLEVTQPGGARTMLPYHAEMIDVVDRETRVIHVHVPTGLFDV